MEYKLPKTKRAGGLRPASLAMSKAAGPAVKRQGIGRTELVTRWHDIVGHDIAKMARPVGMKAAAGRGRNGPTLILATAPKAGFLLQHQTQEIVGRINGFFGEPFVQHLHFEEKRDFKPGRQMAKKVSAPSQNPALSPLEQALERLKTAISGR